MSTKELFNSAIARLESVSNLSIRADTEEYQLRLSSAAAQFLKCQQYVNRFGHFSSNEGIDDISTANIKYLAIDYYLAVVAEKRQPLNPSEPGAATDKTTRLETVKTAISYYFDYFKKLNDYGLLNHDMTASTDSSLSTNTSRPPLISKRLSAAIASGKVSLRDLQSTDPATRRAEKIDRFRKEKAVENAIKSIRDRVKSERTKSRGHRVNTDSLRKSASDSENSDNSEDDDEDLFKFVDEDVVRTLEFAQLQLLALRALNSLETLNMELEMVVNMPSMPSPLPQVEAQDDRERQNKPLLFDKSYTDKIESKLFSRNGPRGGPLLTPDGKVNRPFTIVGNLAQKVQRDDIMKRVRGTGQYAPTMTVEEYLDEEMRRGGIIQGGGNKKPEDDEDEETPEDEDDTVRGYQRSSEKTTKDREWDQFVEANPKGAGNTINRG